MKPSRLAILHACILLALLVLNVYIYLHRNEGYAYQQNLSYPQLYELKEDLHITTLKAKGEDSLQLTISGLPTGMQWQVSCYQEGLDYKSTAPVLKLRPGKKVYELKNLNLGEAPPIKLGINYTPSALYKKNYRNRESVTELFFASVPVGDYKIFSLRDWQQSSPYSTTEEIVQAKQLLHKNIFLDKDTSSLNKIRVIAAFLLRKLDTCYGIPGDTMNVLSAWQRYELALKGGSKVWCGDLSNILAFFLNTQNIVSREVCLEGKINEVYLAGHSLNEVYAPELHQWVLVDLTSKTILPEMNGRYLNLQDLYQLHKNNSSGIRANTVRNDSLVTTDYEQVKNFYIYYFRNTPRFVYYLRQQYVPDLYSFSSKLKRYLRKDATFAVYAGTNTVDNTRFYAKQGAAVLLVLFLIYLLVYTAIRSASRKQNRDRF